MTKNAQINPKELDKKLGKIISASFGFVPDRPFLLSLNLTLGGKRWGCGTGLNFNISDSCKWKSDKQRGDTSYDFLVGVADILTKAKVDSVEDLKNIPIEASFNGNLLVDWRILEEVL